MPPLVSAILPVRDRAAWVARAVASVLAQTYPAIELIVVDDGSADATAAVLDRFGSRLVRLSTPRAGAYAARNHAIAHARGELIAFIDSDDAWRPDHLVRLVPRFERPAVGLVFADAVHVAGTAEALAPTGQTCFGVTPPRRGRVAAHFLWGNFVPTTTAVVRRRVLAEAGPFATDPPLSADYAKWFEIARSHDVDHDDEPGADYTVHAGGISHDLGRSLAARITHFSRLAARVQPKPAQAVLSRLLFHLSLHLAVAWARGRADRDTDALALAWRTGSRAGVRALPWALVFGYHHSLARMRRRVRAG